ncbi:hypothetical protein [Leptospira perolatii]|nr:hypothetical protein [Leptospira perolatii]
MNWLRAIPGWEKGTYYVRWLQELSLTKKLFVVYSIFAVYFLLYHESHLPILWMVGLAFIGYIVSAFLFWGIAFAYQSLESKKQLPDILVQVGLAKPTNVLVPWIETIYFFLSIFICYVSGFFANRSGILFVSVYSGVVLLLRLLNDKLYYKIGFLGILVLASGLGSFKSLQATEGWVAYMMLKPDFKEADLTNWKFDESERLLYNNDIHLSFKLPEDFYFHNPKDLSFEDKTGTGQIAGIISSSETDPNRYPYIKIFYYPETFTRFEEYVAGFKKYIEIKEKRGDIEEVNELTPENFGDKFIGQCWTYYDVLRPRYAKTGIFVYDDKNQSDTLLIQIAESLIKGRKHEESTEFILNNVRRD